METAMFSMGSTVSMEPRKASAGWALEGLCGAWRGGRGGAGGFWGTKDR